MAVPEYLGTVHCEGWTVFFVREDKPEDFGETTFWADYKLIRISVASGQDRQAELKTLLHEINHAASIVVEEMEAHAAEEIGAAALTAFGLIEDEDG